MRIAYITAGAAGTICGSCFHDNTLVAALVAAGHDALLIPTYTPIATDEVDVSTPRIFFGGINVYLQQKSALFRHTPWFLDRLLDGRRLLNWVSPLAVKTRAEELGELTVSMLRGEHGYQRKEIDKLALWLADDVKPQIVNLTNVLLSGMVAELKRRLRVPIVASLQGDDIFLESLPVGLKGEVIRLIQEHCREIDGFIATSCYYADFMSEYLGIPRERIDVVYPGLNLKGHGEGPPKPADQPPTVGYFARICPEKGLHVLVDAYRILRKRQSAGGYKLKISGYLGENQRRYLKQEMDKLESDKLTQHVQHLNAPDHLTKVNFLRGLDVLSVPTTYREPKGLYILEALANRVPVVQPRHGSFPELVEATGGGILVNPDDPEDLARGLAEMFGDRALRERCGRDGQDAVRSRFTAAQMAKETLQIYEKYL
jgi:glycosyltransferase involved in cell wall biosynthesis